MFYRFVKEGKYKDNFFKRFYFFSPSFGNRQYLWIHAVSLGEVRSVREIVNQLKLRTGLPVLLTTVTETGYTEGLNGDFDKVFYLPYDFSFSIKRFMKNLNFQALLIMETEIWPGLLYHVNKSGRPSYIINGRISSKAFKQYLPFRKILNMIFRKRMSRIYCRTEIDRKRYVEIGAPEEKTVLGGNIKLMDNDCRIDEKYRDRLIECLDLINKKIFVAASTHSGEDELLIDVFLKLKEKVPELFLILVPRHPERKNEVLKLLEEVRIKTIFSTELKGNKEAVDSLVIDEIGYLKTIYSISDIIVIGGSFMPIGGHNIFEALIYKAPVFYGPHMDNFVDMDRIFTGNGGIKVSDIDELYTAIVNSLEGMIKIDHYELEQVIEDNNNLVDNMVAEIAAVVNKEKN